MGYFSARSDLPLLQVEDRRTADRGLPYRRGAPRHRTFLRGYLVEQDATIIRTVTIRNLSPEGAKVELSANEGLSQTGSILIPTRQIAYRFSVLWKDIPFAGVTFDEPIDLNADKMMKAVLQRVSR